MLDALSPVALPDGASALPKAPGLWPGEGERWVVEARKHAPGLDGLLTWASGQEASRVSFQTGHPVMLRVHGRNRCATAEPLDDAQISQVANHLYGADGTARLRGGSDFDVRYDIPVDRSRSLRFRLNATPTSTARGPGANIVLRPIADMPPTLAEQRVEEGILEACRPRDGMVIVSGGTGSGKSTLIGGMTVAKLRDPFGHYDIVEAAAPVEFLLDRVRRLTNTINQTEVPRDLPSFEAFIRGTMRREPTDIIVGECRDSATMGAAIQAAISGHTLTTTIHANDVPLTMQRIASLCSAEERDNLITCVAQSLRLVVNQRLALSTDGKRTALREFVVFDQALRTELLVSDPKEWPRITRRAVEGQGQSYPQAIRAALEQGRISEEVAARELREVG